VETETLKDEWEIRPVAHFDIGEDDFSFLWPGGTHVDGVFWGFLLELAAIVVAFMLFSTSTSWRTVKRRSWTIERI